MTTQLLHPQYTGRVEREKRLLIGWPGSVDQFGRLVRQTSSADQLGRLAPQIGPADPPRRLARRPGYEMVICIAKN